MATFLEARLPCSVDNCAIGLASWPGALDSNCLSHPPIQLTPIQDPVSALLVFQKCPVLS